MLNCFFIFIGGGIGSVLRYIAKIFIDKHISLYYPYATLFVNVVGSFFLGFVTAYFLNKTSIPSEIKLFMTVGIAGGFTTFSTFSLECFTLIKNEHAPIAVFYMLASVVLCVLSISAGYALASK